MSRNLRWTESEFDSELAREWRRQNRPAPRIPPKPVPKPRVPTTHRDLVYPLVMLCEAHGLPTPVPEYLFARDFGRLWRLDYAWPAYKIGVEIDGGLWTEGRHIRGVGFIEDQRKRNMSCVLGWRILHYTPDRLSEAIDDLRKVLV